MQNVMYNSEINIAVFVISRSIDCFTGFYSGRILSGHRPKGGVLYSLALHIAFTVIVCSFYTFGSKQIQRSKRLDLNTALVVLLHKDY